MSTYFLGLETRAIEVVKVSSYHAVIHLAKMHENGPKCPGYSEYECPRKANAKFVFDCDGTKLSYKSMTSFSRLSR